MDTRRSNTDSPANAADWLATLMEGKADAATRAAFAEWTRESPANIREWLELTLISADLQAVRLSDETVQSWIDEARQAPVASIHPSAAEMQGPPGPRSFLRSYLAAAVLVALCIVAGGAWWLRGDRYDTSHGEQRMISLSDGSTLSLNTDSQVRVALTARARTVELARGEAYFAVSRDPARPFSVIAGEAVVTAIGTAFNVRATAEGAVVSVAEGKVEVRTRTASEVLPVALTAGERAVVSPHSLTRLRDVKASSAAAWMQGRIEFEAATIEEVMLEFARYSRLEVGFADDTLRQRRITGSFNARDPEAALAYIGTLPGVRVERIAAGEFFIDHDAG